MVLLGGYQPGDRSPSHTEVQWTYSFRKRSWLVTPVVLWVVQNDFAEFMRTALQTMKEAAEQNVRSER